jgi:hypothetical protein
MDKICIEFTAEELETLDVVLDLAIRNTGREFVREILEIEEAAKTAQFSKLQICNLQYCLDVVLTRCGKSAAIMCLLLDNTISKAVKARAA